MHLPQCRLAGGSFRKQGPPFPLILQLRRAAAVASGITTEQQRNTSLWTLSDGKDAHMASTTDTAATDTVPIADGYRNSTSSVSCGLGVDAAQNQPSSISLAIYVETEAPAYSYDNEHLLPHGMGNDNGDSFA
eukprot:Opistho-2@96874